MSFSIVSLAFPALCEHCPRVPFRWFFPGSWIISPCACSDQYSPEYSRGTLCRSLGSLLSAEVSPSGCSVLQIPSWSLQTLNSVSGSLPVYTWVLSFCLLAWKFSQWQNSLISPISQGSLYFTTWCPVSWKPLLLIFCLVIKIFVCFFLSSPNREDKPSPCYFIL